MDTIERLSSLTRQQLIESKSLDFCRFIALKWRHQHRTAALLMDFGSRWPKSPNLDLVRKAAVAVGLTSDATWAGPLAPSTATLASAFLEYLRPQTLLGRIPGLRQVPFNVGVAAQTAAGTYGWLGQAKPTPVTKADYGTVSVGFAKAAGIIVVSEELVKLSEPGAELVLRREMARGIAAFLDTQFVDPTVAAVAGVNPASITNGTVAIVSSGTSQANANTDIQALITQFVAANPRIENAVLLMKPANAVALSRATGQLSLGLTGGSLFGIPVVTSGSVGDLLILLDADGVLYAEGGLEIDASISASLQMDSAPADPTVASTVFVSLFERNLVGLRAVRMINWVRRAVSSVKYVSGATYV